MAKAQLVPRRTFRDISRVADHFLATHHPTGELPIPIEEIIEFEKSLRSRGR